jgi:disulfide bond formation protein DsbB
MVIFGLILILIAIGIYITAENVMIKPLGFIIGVIGLYIMLKYKPKSEVLGKKGEDVVD